MEEDYRLDIAAIERLQRRFPDTSNIITSNPISSNVVPTSIVPSSFDALPNGRPSSEWRTEQRPAVFPPVAQAKPQNDDLEDAPQTMYGYGANRR